MLTNTPAFWRIIADWLLLDTFQEMTTYSTMTTRPNIELVRPRSMWQAHVKNMRWPAQSPHLNVIEKIWLYIKGKLEVRIHKINSNSDLFREIFCIWQTIPLTYIRNLYIPILRRILNVIRLKGYLTKYYR
jgi:hypothetical protein